MKPSKSFCCLDFKYFYILIICTTAHLGISESLTNSKHTNAGSANFTVFLKYLESGDDIEACSIGNTIFKRLEKRYGNDTGFKNIRTRLLTAETLAEQMTSALLRETKEQIRSAINLFLDENKRKKTRLIIVHPAKLFYQDSAKLFSKPARISNLDNEEKTFLTKYYNLRLRILIHKIAEAGKNLAIAEPDFSGTHDYVLILPLLHATDQQPINIDTLPKWMQKPEHLDMLSDSCLQHFSRPLQAMMISQRSAELQGKPFSEYDFYIYTAKKYAQYHPLIANDCLHRAIDYVKDKEPDTVVALQLELIQKCLDFGDYALAANQAHKIFKIYPDHKEAGNAVWLYFYALSKNSNVERILTEIDEALSDERCQDYKLKLLYTKWWALCHKRETARIAALEYEIFKQYGDDPITAPILFYRAQDLLAQQDYDDARVALNQLIEKFPSTKTASEAKRVLKTMKVIK